MPDPKPACLVCGQTSDDLPLLTLIYRGINYWICPQHFPILIHQPAKLVGILPGAEHLAAHEDHEG
ncbi:MAG: hypothetical protein P4L50_23200 [Anaerolineaceae bacterium]|nr:hypothetical protein [Anaerolineaceae bacterium]